MITTIKAAPDKSNTAAALLTVLFVVGVSTVVGVVGGRGHVKVAVHEVLGDKAFKLESYLR